MPQPQLDFSAKGPNHLKKRIEDCEMGWVRFRPLFKRGKIVEPADEAGGLQVISVQGLFNSPVEWRVSQ